MQNSCCLRNSHELLIIGLESDCIVGLCRAVLLDAGVELLFTERQMLHRVALRNDHPESLRILWSGAIFHQEQSGEGKRRNRSLCWVLSSVRDFFLKDIGSLNESGSPVAPVFFICHVKTSDPAQSSVHPNVCSLQVQLKSCALTLTLNPPHAHLTTLPHSYKKNSLILEVPSVIVTFQRVVFRLVLNT